MRPVCSAVMTLSENLSPLGRAQDAARVRPVVEQVDSSVDVIVAPAEQDPATPPPAPSTLLVQALAGLVALLVWFMGVAGALTALALWLGMKPLRALLVAHGATWFVMLGTPNNGRACGKSCSLGPVGRRVALRNGELDHTPRARSPVQSSSRCRR